MTYSLILMELELDINVIYFSIHPSIHFFLILGVSQQPWTVGKALENRRVRAGLKS